MILLDSRVTNYHFRHSLKVFCPSHPEVKFVLPKFSFSDLAVYIFTIAIFPIALVLSILEVTRTRSKFLSSISMHIPVFITKKIFSEKSWWETNFIIQSLVKYRGSRLRDTNRALSNFSPQSKLGVRLSSPLLPFNSLYPKSKEDKYISVIKFVVDDIQLPSITKLAKLPFLPSVADTYENSLCHYFDLIKETIHSPISESRFVINCGNKFSNPLDLISQFVRRISTDISKILRSVLLKKKYTWYVRVQARNTTSNQKFYDLENPGNGYYADPFLFEYQDEVFLFVEEYSFSTLKGVVSVFKFEDGDFKRLGVCLEELFHISFPNIFVDGEDIYMIPETSANRDVRLYRAVEFPMKWELSTQLLKDISAVDSTIYRNNDYYYLLTTVDTNELGDHSTNLNMYKSSQLNGHIWLESDKNPVIRDAEKGRNAGRYHESLNERIRIAQASEFGTYGKKISVHSVEAMSLEEYAELEIELPKLEVPIDSQGHHHLSLSRDFMAFDFSRFVK